MLRTMQKLYGLAENQAGYFTSGQAVQAGVTHRVLSGRAAQGDIEQVRHGIYRIRDFPAHPFEDVSVACLWVGPDSAASHETALAIHGISDAMPATIQVTTPRDFRGSRPGTTVHWAPLTDAEREIINGIPVTTISRTLQDISSASDPTLVRQAIEQALQRDVVSKRQLRRIVRDTPGLGPAIVDVLAAE